MVALGVAVATGIGFAFYASRPFEAAAPTRPGPEASEPAPEATVAPPSTRHVTPTETPPESLRDSEIDGALARDTDGRFAPDRGALALFDYFLSATGEQPLPVLRARIVTEITRRLPPAAAREAESFLDRYLAYRDAAREMGADDRLASGSDLERRLQWLGELRREHFGAALAERLFGDDERSVALAIERRRVSADPALSPEERRARIDALEAELPASTRRARAEAVLPLQLQQDEAALRAAGADAAAIRALREARVGSEAADRLDALDARREAWDLRVAAYRSERLALEEAEPLEAAEREAAIETLRARHFDATEQIRVRALDEMETTPPQDAARTSP